MAKRTLEDLSGMKFGLLTAINRAPNKGRATAWFCSCDCGGYIETRAGDLKSGRVKSCGCIRKRVAKRNTFIDIEGVKFGRLTAIKQVGSRNGRAMWLFQCECGKVIAASGKDVRTGNTQSCGCQKIEKSGYKCGPKHPNYNPLLSDEDRQKCRLIPEYLNWTKKVYELYDYTCQKCHRRGNGIVIHAHHIESYGSNKDLRTDAENGIVLCKDCHYCFHGKYGRNTNRKQLEEFLSEIDI